MEAKQKVTNMFLMERLIEEAPVPVISMDKGLVCINHSNKFQQAFSPDHSDLSGKHITEIIPDIPPGLLSHIENGLSGIYNQSDGTRFESKNKAHIWYKWDVTPWKIQRDTLGGVVLILEDVTAKKREEELLSSALQVAKIGGWEVDLIANTIHWTDITREIHEVPEDFVPNLETGINFYKEGKSRETITKLIQRAIEHGESWDVELQLVTYTQKEIWVRAKGASEMVNGKCIRFFGTFQDIDKAKKIDLAYKEISERFKIAKDAAKIGIWEYNIAESSLVWDQTMYDIYGINESDFSGVYEAWKGSVHPEDQERCQAEVNEAVKGNKDFNTSFRVVWPNGEIRHITAASVIITNETTDKRLMVGANWDITELIRAKQSLERSQESFEGAFQNSTIGMAIVGIDGSWIDVNDSLCFSLGYSKKKLLTLTFQDITHPEDLKKDLGLLTEVIEGNRNSYSMEKRYFHAKGHIVHVILTVTAVKDINGNLLHFISQIVDISSRMNAEEKLRNILKITNTQNKSLLNFAHIVSHNLRSHSSNLSMLSNFLLEEQDEKEKLTIEKLIRDSSKSLNETVVHLNEVVQVKTNTVENLESISLNDTLLHVKNSINGLIEKHEVSCSIKINKVFKIKAVKAYLESILLNLFTNSIKYKHPDRNPVIEINAYAEGPYKILEFKDNGIGIDLKKYGTKIFGMYKTFHKHPEAKGIGLFITKNQIEAMNGKIEVSSVVNEGTSFKVYFQKG